MKGQESAPGPPAAGLACQPLLSLPPDMKLTDCEDGKHSCPADHKLGPEVDLLKWGFTSFADLLTSVSL